MNELPLITVTLPSEVRTLCGGRVEVPLRAASVGELLGELARLHPKVHVRLCNERGEPRPHINVFVNEDHIRSLTGLSTPLSDNDVVTILPAVSGG